MAIGFGPIRLFSAVENGAPCACDKPGLNGGSPEAGEPALEGIDQHSLARGIAATGKPVVAIDNAREIVPLLRRHGRPGDSVIFLGAGNSTEWAHALGDWLSVEAAQ